MHVIGLVPNPIILDKTDLHPKTELAGHCIGKVVKMFVGHLQINSRHPAMGRNSRMWHFHHVFISVPVRCMVHFNDTCIEKGA